MKFGKEFIKVVSFAAVIICALLAVQWYQMECMTHLREEVYVVGSSELSKNLVKGSGPEQKEYQLKKVSRDEPVYRRGSNLYVGQGKDKIEGDFPFFTNDGNAVMIMKDDPVLLDQDFQEARTFQGMYVSDGLTFNFDRSQADEGSFLFLKLDNGLFMNTQTIHFDFPGGTRDVRMNGIFYFGTDGVRYYKVEGEKGTLVYGELPTTKMMKVTIGDVTVSYEQLLELLGIISIGKEVQPAVPEKKEEPSFEEIEPETAEASTNPEGEEEQEKEKNQKEQESEAQESQNTTPQAPAPAQRPEGWGDRDKDSDAYNQGQKDGIPDQLPDGWSHGRGDDLDDWGSSGSQGNSGNDFGSGSGSGSGSTSGSGSGSGSGSTSGNGSGNTSGDSSGSGTENGSGGNTEGNQPGGSGSGSSSGSGNNGGSGSSEGSGSGGGDSENQGGAIPEIPFQYPTATLTGLTTDVYSMDGLLTITDPAFVAKRVVLELYWQPENEDGTPKKDSSNPKDYELMYRKTFRGQGDVHIDNLPPDTVIYARGLIYYTKDGKTENQVFYEGFEQRLKTLSLDYVDDLYFEFMESQPDMVLLPYQIKVYQVAISGPNANVLDKIGAIKINLTAKSGPSTGEKFTLQMGLGDAKNNYFYQKDREKRPVWVSEKVDLPANTEYEYTIDILDMFNNPFTRVAEGYMDNTINQEENKSLNCCPKSGSYYTPAGYTRTCKTVPTVAMHQRGFDDGEKNINRVRYELSFTDTYGAYAGLEDSYYIQVFEDGDSSHERPVTFQTPDDNGSLRSVTTLPIRKENLQGTPSQYDILELTAGKIYEFVIYGDYDLQDEQGICRKRIVGSQRFSTISLSTYGRVSYNLTSSHIRMTDPNGLEWENATAQEVTMGINWDQTKDTLVELYMDRADIEVIETRSKKKILSGTMTKAAMEKVIFQGEGGSDERTYSFELDQLIPGVTGVNLPKVTLQAPDFAPGETRSLWQLFTSKTEASHLVFRWGKGELTSITSYQMNVTTWASQGGVNDHNVTSRSTAYKRLDFTTLKEMPYISYGKNYDILTVGDYVRVYGLEFNDTDKAIIGGKVRIELTGTKSQTIELDYETLKGGFLDEIQFTGLTVGSKYTMSIIPEVIRRDTYGNWTLYDTVLQTFTFTAGEGLSGELVFENIDYPLEENPEIEGNYQKSDFSLYNAAGYAVGTPDSNGMVADTDRTTAGGWMTSPYIPVAEGDVYYINKTRESSASNYTTNVWFYKEEGGQRVVIDAKSWAPYESSGTRLTGGLAIQSSGTAFQIPEGVSYMRFTMYGHVDYIPSFATANCLYLSKAKAVEPVKGVTVDSSTGIVSFPVEPGAMYTMAKGYASYEVGYVDESGKAVGDKITDTGYRLGYIMTAPAGAARANVTIKNKSYFDLSLYEGGIYKVLEEKLAWLESKDLRHFSNSISVNVKDINNNLIQNGDNQVYLDIYKNNSDKPLSGLEDPLRDIREELVLKRNQDGTVTVTADLSKLVNFLGDVNCTYKLELYVYYTNNHKRNKIVLDTVEFQSNRVLEVIHDRNELGKLSRYPTGNFMVVNDIILRDNEQFYYSDTIPFQGTIDFQGHSLTKNYTTGGNGIASLGSNGLIKNLVLNVNMNAGTNRTGISGVYGLVGTNYGTIQDVVVNLGLGDGMYRKTYIGGLVGSNRGVIENFVVRYGTAGSNFVGYQCGGVARWSSGIIRNGAVYASVVNVNTGVFMGSDTLEAAYNGLVVGYPEVGSIIENVYAVGNMAVEQAGKNTHINGLITGRATGVVRNSFSVGEIRNTVWRADGTRSSTEISATCGPAIGTIAKNNPDIQNTFFFTTEKSKVFTRDFPNHKKETDFTILQDPEFYNVTVNQGQKFDMEDLRLGYYPRVKMSEEMKGKQRPEPLPDVAKDTIQLLSTDVLEAHDDYAIAVMKFNNQVEQTINSVQVEGLNVEILTDPEHTQGTSEDGKEYQVYVKLTPSTRYRDRYPVTSFTYGSRDQKKVLDDPGNPDNPANADNRRRDIVVTFYKHVTQDNWGTAFSNSGDFYRIVEDIDFSLPPYDNEVIRNRAQSSIRAMGAFTGILDGEYNGAIHTVKNLNLVEYPYLFDEVKGGKVQNLIVEDMVIEGGGKRNVYTGFVGRSTNGAAFRNIVLKNSRIRGVYQYGGALVAHGTNTSIIDCVAVETSINSAEIGMEMRIGSLAGYLNGGRIENCLSRKINIDANLGQSAEAIGGLTGHGVGNSIIQNCYAQGSVKSGFAKTGGLAGRGEVLNVSKSWSKVNINGASNFVGGILGQGNNSTNLGSLLSAGEIFTAADNNYGRIVGGYLGGTPRRRVRCYGTADQKINSEVLTDPMDAEGLLTESQLMMEQHYWNSVTLGDAFDYSVVEEGKLPLLFNQKGTALLPEQGDGTPITSASIEFTASGTAEYKDSGTGGSRAGDYDLTLNLTFSTEKAPLNQLTQENYGSSYASYFGASYENIVVEDMVKDGFKLEGQPQWDGKNLSLTFTGIKPEKYMDGYRVLLNYGDEPSIARLVFTDKDSGKEVPLYRHIYRVQSLASDGTDYGSWQDAMAYAGTRYENFLIMEDLDFTNASERDARVNLRVNRLEGCRKPVKDLTEEGVPEAERKAYLTESLSGGTSPYVVLYNFTYTDTQSDSSGWFFEVRGEIKNIRFQNIKWRRTPAGSNIGIIRQMNGTMSFVDIVDTEIDYGLATERIGFISTANGNVRYVRGKNIKVYTTDTSTRSVNRVGGIVGYSTVLLDHISVSGTTPQGDNPAGYYSDYRIEGSKINATGGSYTGGIVGHAEVPGIIYVYGDTIQVTGRTGIGGLGGWISANGSQYQVSKTQWEQEGKIYLTEIRNSRIRGVAVVGAAYGYGYYVRLALSEKNQVESTANQAGGIVGGSYTIQYSKAIDCQITAGGDFAGGINSCANDYGFDEVEVRGCTITARNYAGGLTGRGAGCSNALVENCAIYADNYTGGLFGLSDYNGTTNRGLVRNCHLGRTVTEYPAVEKNADNTYTLTWKQESGSSSAYVGGFAGGSYGSQYRNSVVDDSVVIKGLSNIGGAMGAGGGGESYNVEVSPKIEASGNYVGGFAGELYGYAESPRGKNMLARPVTKFDRAIIVADAAGNAYVGGFAGSYAPGEVPRDPDTGQPIEGSGHSEYLTKQNISHVILGGQITGTSSVGVIGSNINGNNPAREDEGINYLRIVEGMKQNNNPQSMVAQNLVMGQSDTDYSKPFVVTIAQLKTSGFYYNAEGNGGMDFDKDGKDGATSKRNFHFDDDQAAKGYFPWVSRETNSELVMGDWTEFYFGTSGTPGSYVNPQDGIPIPGTPQGITFFGLDWNTDELFEDIAVYASGAGTMNLEFPAEIAEFGAYGAEVKKEMAETGLSEAEMSETGAEQAGLNVATQSEPGRIGDDEALAEMMIPDVYFEIFGPDGRLLERTDIDRQTYTIPYDFDTTLTIRVTLDHETRSFAVTKEELRNTVMSWGSHCYYLKKDGVYSDNGAYSGTGTYDNVRKVMDGSFVHLYQGRALDDDGRIYDVESGSQTGELDSELLFKSSQDSIPAYVTEFDGEEIRTYRSYSLTGDVSSSQESEPEDNRSDYRLVAKNGKLFGLDPELDADYGMGFRNFLADYYSTSQGSTEYLSIVTPKNVLEDRKSPISWPKDDNQKEILNKFQVAELGDNIYCDESYVILRYCDNTTAAFDYLTGTLLFKDDSEKKELGFLEYATMWMEGKSSSMKVTAAYNSASGLVNSLTVNPIDDNALIGIGKDGEVPKDPAQTAKKSDMDIAIDSSNTEGGKNQQEGKNQTAGEKADQKETVSAAAGENGIQVSDEGSQTPADNQETLESNEPTGDAGNAENGIAETGNAGAGIAESGIGEKADEAEAEGENGQGTEITGGESGDGQESGAVTGKTETGVKRDAAAGKTETGHEADAPEGGTDREADAPEAGVGHEAGTPEAGAGLETDISRAGTGERTDTTQSDPMRDHAAEISSEASRKTEDTILPSDGNQTVGAGKLSGSDTNETGHQRAKDDPRAKTAGPSLNSDRAYVTMLTAEANGYEVFRAQDLLSKDSSSLISENRKVEIMQENGIRRNAIDLEAMKVTADQNQTGLILVAGAAACMIALLMILHKKKRKLNME